MSMVLTQSTSCWFFSNPKSPIYLMMLAKHSRAILFISAGSSLSKELKKKCEILHIFSWHLNYEQRFEVSRVIVFFVPNENSLLFKNADTPHNFRGCARWKAPEKCFKICHIFGVRKPNFFFSFFISRYFGFVTKDALVYVLSLFVCKHKPGHPL